MTIPTAAGQWWTAKAEDSGWDDEWLIVHIYRHGSRLCGPFGPKGLFVPVDDPRWTWGEQIRVQDDGRVERRCVLLPEDSWVRLCKASTSEGQWSWFRVIKEVNAIINELSAATDTQGTGDTTMGHDDYVPAGHHIVEDADGERLVKNESATLATTAKDKILIEDLTKAWSAAVRAANYCENAGMTDTLAAMTEIVVKLSQQLEFAVSMDVESSFPTEDIAEAGAVKTWEEMAADKDAMGIRIKELKAERDDLRQQLAKPRGRLVKDDATRRFLFKMTFGYGFESLGRPFTRQEIQNWDNKIDALNALDGEDAGDKRIEALQQSLKESRDEMTEKEAEIDRLTAELARLREGRGASDLRLYRYKGSQSKVCGVYIASENKRYPCRVDGIDGPPDWTVIDGAVEWLTPQPAHATAEATVDLESISRRVLDIYKKHGIHHNRSDEDVFALIHDLTLAQADIARSVVREMASGEGGE